MSVNGGRRSLNRSLPPSRFAHRLKPRQEALSKRAEGF